MILCSRQKSKARMRGKIYFSVSCGAASLSSSCKKSRGVVHCYSYALECVTKSECAKTKVLALSALSV
jgi:hypothetical protein